MACHHVHAIGALLLALPAATGKPPLLPRCTIAVAGANGRVGSAVCREILRSHPQVTVRALVRDAGNPWEGYGRLSYEVGAEEGKMDLRPAWALDEDGRFGQPASMEFDPDVQGNYGLDRLEIRECELRYRKDVDDVLSDVDAVVYCATGAAHNTTIKTVPPPTTCQQDGLRQRAWPRVSAAPFVCSVQRLPPAAA